MAFTGITTQKPGVAGLDPTETNGIAGSTTVGHKFANTGNTWLMVRNQGVGTVTLNLKRGGTLEGVAIADQAAITVAAAATKYFGPFSRDLYNSRSDEGFLEFFFDGGDETDARVSIIE